MRDIFNLEALYRIKRPSPQVSHIVCNHKEGMCVQDGVDEWHQPWVTKKWVAAFQHNLFFTQMGKDVWTRLMKRNLDAGRIIESVALAVGDKDESRRALARQSQARLLKEFFIKANSTILKVKSEFEEINAKRNWPVFSPSIDWPVEVSDFEESLSQTLEKMTLLIRHYKPISHARRNKDISEGFMVSVQWLRDSSIKDGDITTLLNAGYAVSGKTPIGNQELRERMTSAVKLYGKNR